MNPIPLNAGDFTQSLFDGTAETLYGLIALPVLMAIVIGLIFYLKRTRYRY